MLTKSKNPGNNSHHNYLQYQNQFGVSNIKEFQRSNNKFQYKIKPKFTAQLKYCFSNSPIETYMHELTLIEEQKGKDTIHSV